MRQIVIVAAESPSTSVRMSWRVDEDVRTAHEEGLGTLNRQLIRPSAHKLLTDLSLSLSLTLSD